MNFSLLLFDPKIDEALQHISYFFQLGVVFVKVAYFSWFFRQMKVVMTFY